MPYYTSIKLINVHKVFKILKTFWHGVPIAHTVIICYMLFVLTISIIDNDYFNNF